MDDLGKGGDDLGGDARSVVEIVRTGSEIGVDEGAARTRERQRGRACKPPRIGPSASTSATPAIAAKEGSRFGRSQRRTVEGMEMRTFGDEQGA